MGELSSAAEIIARLELRPHPEGGHYRETFRDSRVDAGGRSRSSAIYFLLARGECDRGITRRNLGNEHVERRQVESR